MKSQTEEMLWIAAQEDSLMPKEIVDYAIKNRISLSEILEYSEDDFKGVTAQSVKRFFEKTNNIDVTKYGNIWNSAYEQEVRLITYDDIYFPKKLRELESQSTILLYHKGAGLSFENCIAVVGTRNCSTYGAEFARSVSRKIAESGHTVVAGLATGIDAIAHRGALSVGGKTIAVLAWMFNPYPKENRKLLEEITNDGFAISDTYFTNQSGLARAKFVHRNEIISGISDVLIAVESSVTGGTVHQVQIAKRQKKLVLTLEPEEENTVAYKGFEKFVELGAVPVKSVEQVMTIIENNKKRQQSDLDKKEKTLFEYST
jgi:DNA processing protein